MVRRYQYLVGNLMTFRRELGYASNASTERLPEQVSSPIVVMRTNPTWVFTNFVHDALVRLCGIDALLPLRRVFSVTTTVVTWTFSNEARLPTTMLCHDGCSYLTRQHLPVVYVNSARAIMTQGQRVRSLDGDFSTRSRTLFASPYD